MAKVAYISDLHLEFFAENVKKQFGNDTTIKDMADMFCKQLNATEHNFAVLAGDVSHCCFTVTGFLSFVDEQIKKPLYFCLGNHDYWNWSSSFGYHDKHDPYDMGYRLSPNTIAGVEEYFENEINKLKHVKFLKAGKTYKFKDITIIGDCGFCAFNNAFNCKHGIYRGILAWIEKERELTLRWKDFFRQTLESKKPKGKLLIVTHTPPRDWGWNTHTEEQGVFHIFGHVHDCHNGEAQEYTIEDPDGKFGAYGDAANGYERHDFNFKVLAI
jgi:predicted phosphohydrolase